MENQNQTSCLPAEVEQIAQNVSIEKRNEVQNVLNQVFSGVSKMREQLDSVVVENENDKTGMKLAKTVRLSVRDIRLDAERNFDAKRSEVQQKMIHFKTEDSLWLKAKQTMQILTKEIEEQARWKEETKERFDAEQKELKAQQRLVQVSKFNQSIVRSEFENMSDETFDSFLAGLEKSYNDAIESERKAKEAAEAKAKAEREEQERIKAENERLRKEAEAKEQLLLEERRKAEEAKKEAELKAKKEREEVERKAAEEEKKRQSELQKEREEKAKIQAELKAREDAELKAKKEAEAKIKAEEEAAKKAAKAPIKKQLTAWVESFSLGKPLSENEVSKEIEEKFTSFKSWAKKQIENL